MGSPAAQNMKDKLQQSLALLKDRIIANIDSVISFIFSYCRYIQLKKVQLL